MKGVFVPVDPVIEDVDGTGHHGKSDKSDGGLKNNFGAGDTKSKKSGQKNEQILGELMGTDQLQASLDGTLFIHSWNADCADCADFLILFVLHSFLSVSISQIGVICVPLFKKGLPRSKSNPC